MTKIDDLSLGDWVVVTSIRPQDTKDSTSSFLNGEPPSFAYGTIDPTENYRAIAPVNGCPLQIIAIGLPFVGVTSGDGKTALDVREVTLQKVSLDYAAMMNVLVNDWDAEEVQTPEGTYTRFIPDLGEEIPPPIPDDPQTICPGCEEKYHLQYSVSSREWSYACLTPGCGYKSNIKVNL